MPAALSEMLEPSIAEFYMKLILLGNAGAGKSTMARHLIGSRNIPRLSLDEIAWDRGAERKLLHASLRELRLFVENNAAVSESWRGRVRGAL
jgi:adenylate kinase family enzyme